MQPYVQKYLHNVFMQICVFTARSGRGREKGGDDLKIRFQKKLARQKNFYSPKIGKKEMNIISIDYISTSTFMWSIFQKKSVIDMIDIKHNYHSDQEYQNCHEFQLGMQ